MKEKNIMITADDAHHLRELLKSRGRLDGADKQHLRDLAGELDRASIVPAGEIPPWVVTMHSTFRLTDLDTGLESDYTLVYPGQANLSRGRLSVLAPVGTALLGYQELDTIEWPVPAGTKRIRIEKVISQPEAARGVAA